jgi:hypothetical protein
MGWLQQQFKSSAIMDLFGRIANPELLRRTGPELSKSGVGRQ